MWKIGLNILAIALIAFAVVYRMNYSEKEITYDARAMGVRGGDFSLKSGERQIGLADFKGKTVVMYFGFASCPDVCPMALSYLNGVLNDFPQKDQVQVVFVSVDYKRDTPESVAKYAKFFNKEFVGATGSKEAIEAVTDKYNVYYKFIEMKDSEMGYTVDHSSKFFILDAEGEVRKVVGSEEDPEVFRRQLASVVKEK